MRCTLEYSTEARAGAHLPGQSQGSCRSRGCKTRDKGEWICVSFSFEAAPRFAVHFHGRDQGPVPGLSKHGGTSSKPSQRLRGGQPCVCRSVSVTARHTTLQHMGRSRVLAPAHSRPGSVLQNVHTNDTRSPGSLPVGSVQPNSLVAVLGRTQRVCLTHFSQRGRRSLAAAAMSQHSCVSA